MGDVDASRFFTVYDNIPIKSRKELILMIDDQPISWEVAYSEIKNKTKLGARILEWLIKLELV